MESSYSIILPVRNGGEYVKDCINSILIQSYRNFDLLILDNNSSDGTIDWIKSLGDNRIKIFLSSKDLSIEENWNRITIVQKNEFITLIGHDDMLNAEYLQTMDSLIKKHPTASLYQTHFNYIDSESKLVRQCQPMAGVQYVHEFLDCQMNQRLDSTGTGYMMRSKDYDVLGGISPAYPKLIFADYELWVKLISKSYKATSQKVCFSYRLHESVSRLTNGEDYQQAFGRYILFLNSIKGGNNDINAVIQQNGKKMLLYFCQSLSHRLLKTPKGLRKTSVGSFIAKCREYAKLLIPGQAFNPLSKPGILAAKLLDNKPGLALFSAYKKITSGK
ncbi:MAG: glycosyltransferase [Bacteroidota bacterium]|nr:glycosyltransferase [Bacteroidota bacterium]